ncbi:MAG: hypothetical protein JXN61_17490 [Sedimentisphaerales bacterium]|nr:hypothetical protein [Sedimentisphaerales bacterium]
MKEDKESRAWRERELEDLVHYLLLQAETSGDASAYLSYIRKILAEREHLSDSQRQELLQVLLDIGKQKPLWPKYTGLPTFSAMPESDASLRSTVRRLEADLDRWRLIIGILENENRYVKTRVREL